MTLADAVAGAKARLDIPDSVTTFDSKLQLFAADAVNRIPPHAYKEVPKQAVSVSVDDFGEAIITLSSLTIPVDDIRKVEASNGGAVFPATGRAHGGLLTVRELPSDTTTVYVYGLAPYLITELPAMFNQGVIWFMMADFYAFLAANKKSYNVYMQNGANAVDNMQNLAEYWEQKAMDYVAEKGQLYGR